MRVYLASSWRNEHQPAVLRALRASGHQVYDFRHPYPGSTGFKWSEIDPEWLGWDGEAYREALRHPKAEDGFELDMVALRECDACVLLLPSGRSAHLEAGYAVGAGKSVYVLWLGQNEPELMYGMTAGVALSVQELLSYLEAQELSTTYAYTVPPGERMCRVCGCWDQHACPEGCHWVEFDLCSSCVEPEAVLE